jgi:uncharacterized protein
MQIIRKSEFTTTPWKNGGGITHEAIRVPPTGESFRWRLSVAEIEASGPFSDFAGYDRKMALLRGAGVSLTFENGQITYLRAAGDLVEFDGALRTECELLDGPCVDLNLMVSQALEGVKTWVHSLARPVALDSSRSEMTLVFGISGTLSVAGGDRDATQLEPWDLAVIPPGTAGTISPVFAADSLPTGPAADSVPLVFFATLDDNPP